MSQSDAGKTDKPRPCLVSREERDLRWALLYGTITRDTFDKRLKEIKDAEQQNK